LGIVWEKEIVMKNRANLLAIVGWTFLLIGETAHAQDAKLLRIENRALRAQVESLRKELASTKSLADKAAHLDLEQA